MSTSSHAAALVLLSLALIGLLPTLASFAQFMLIGIAGVRSHLRFCADTTPRVAFVLPAWNEADVIGASIDALMALDYPAGHWRMFVVDDASTDDTPRVLQEKMAQYPGYVVHLRRDVGGQGKAHTLNHGLAAILADDWAQAVMIMDADVLFEPLTLRRMARHLADPAVGAVTAYVKEGSVPGNTITRSVGFEYITAQAAARRAQTLLGMLACLAGGAQLHSRANLEAIGGAIDTSTLAEDTYTTFATQIRGRRAIFDGTAAVWAEEPDTLDGLWRQRLRWARGNVQLTMAFGRSWFRDPFSLRIGGIVFGLLWFAVVLAPVFTTLRAVAMWGLEALHSPLAATGFVTLWGSAAALFLFETAFALAIDPATARRVWREGLLYPGAISLAFMLFAVVPASSGYVWSTIAAPHGIVADCAGAVVFGWGIISMLAGWCMYRLERSGCPRAVRSILLFLFGYGAVIAAIAAVSLLTYRNGGTWTWQKTIKTGKARILQ